MAAKIRFYKKDTLPLSGSDGVYFVRDNDEFSIMLRSSNQLYTMREDDPTVPAHVKAITDTEIGNWSAAFGSMHSHSNKAVLDGITSGKVSNWDDAFTMRHSHANKAVLDAIEQPFTSTLKTKLDGLDQNKYTFRANSTGSSANSVLSSDTRSTNPLPSTDLKVGVWFDFKQSSAIGLTGSDVGTYGAAMTFVPYADNSGNNGAAYRLTHTGVNLFYQTYNGSWQAQKNLWASTKTLLTTGEVAGQIIRYDGTRYVNWTPNYLVAADLSDYVTKSTSQNITAFKNFTGQVEFKTASGVPAFFSSSTITNNYVVFRHHSGTGYLGYLGNDGGGALGGYDGAGFALNAESRLHLRSGGGMYIHAGLTSAILKLDANKKLVAAVEGVDYVTPSTISGYVLKTGDVMSGRLQAYRSTGGTLANHYSSLQIEVGDNDYAGINFHKLGISAVSLYHNIHSALTLWNGSVTSEWNVSAGSLYGTLNHIHRTDSQNDGRYVIKTGDTMTGALNFNTSGASGLMLNYSGVAVLGYSASDLILSNSTSGGGHIYLRPNNRSSANNELKLDASGYIYYRGGDMYFNNNSTASNRIYLGNGAPGDKNSGVFMAGNTAYSSWGMAVFREAAHSYILHRGNGGDLSIEAVESSNIKFMQSGATKGGLLNNGSWLFGAWINYGSKVNIESGTDTGAGLYVRGAIATTSIASGSLVKISSGVLTAAVAGTDYLTSALISGSYIQNQFSVAQSANICISGKALFGSNTDNGYKVQISAGGPATSGLWVDGIIHATGNIRAFSDSSLKTDIRRIADPISAIKRLHGYSYNYAGMKDYGLLADEVEWVLPHAVGRMNGKLTLAYHAIHALAVEAIGELIRRDESKDEKIERLETRVSELERRLAICA